MSQYEIYQIFTKYAPICGMQYHYNTSKHLRIHFKSNANTEKLKSQHELVHNDRTFSIYWLDDETTKMIADKTILMGNIPKQKSPLHILNVLTDKFFRRIFACDILNQSDLCAIGMTCKRFNRLANEIFTIKYINADTKETYIDWTQPLWQIDDCLRLFGRPIESLTAKLHINIKDTTIGLINHYCDKLTRFDVEISTGQIPAEMFLLMRRLEEFSLSLCFSRCLNNRHIPLRLYHLPPIACPKLVNFDLAAAQIYGPTFIDAFFAVNPQIRTLSLRRCIFDFGIQHILRHLPNIQVLRCEALNKALVDIFHKDQVPMDTDVTCIGQMKQLKEFHSMQNGDLTKCILTVIEEYQLPLECLTVAWKNNDQDVLDCICRIKTIKSLSINTIDGYALILLALSLRNMTNFSVQSKKLDFEDIHRMLEVANSCVEDVDLLVGLKEINDIDRDEMMTIETILNGECCLRLKVTVVEIAPIPVSENWIFFLLPAFYLQ